MTAHAGAADRAESERGATGRPPATLPRGSSTRLSSVRDARSNVVFYAYDANSNPTNISSLEKSDLGNPDQTFATRYVYDARDRLVETATGQPV